ncbi:DMT family transporter [Limnobacter humi]|uniref:DMT family transporter n=1 Tax=Limnobacter humi TaxID=1778671 RepID=A0ABT1WKJ5_9BURK|nr:DMT family transporter [Limnobacter humi]MCQ8897696.1 DMT family transporter [Limnobacter humi]
MTPTSRPQPMLMLKLTLVALFWGGTFVAGRTVAQHLPAMTAAFGRYLVAAVLLVGVAFHREGGLKRLNREQWLTTAALGATGIALYNICFFAALAHMPAGRTALIVSLNPIMTAVLASIVFRERLGGLRWAGIALALFGAGVVVTRGDLLGTLHNVSQSLGPGEGLMAIAVLGWACYTLVSRKAGETLTPIAAITWATLWGLLFLLLGSLHELGSIQWAEVPWQVWAALLYLGAFGTVVAFLWFYQGVQQLGPSRTAVFTNLVPVFGIALSALILREPILISMLVGGSITAFGVYLTNRVNINPAQSPNAGE